jgi:PAS domain S-box-containing protein
VGQNLGIIRRDITDFVKVREKLRESSEYVRSLIEASLDPLVAISLDGKIADVNAATIQVTGATREELIGSEFAGYVTEPPKAREGCEKALTEGYVKNLPLTIRHKSGSLTDVNCNASVYRNPDGGVAGIIATARDVTEMNRLVQRLHRAELISAVEQMGATVAHDLRGPLSQIVQAVNLVKQGPSLNPRMLQIIEENASRSLKMIADWRLSTREIVPHKVETDLTGLVKSVLEGSMIQGNLEVWTSFASGLDSVLIDPDIMNRVLNNLIKNACEAMPEGGKLSISTENGVNAVIVKVSDTGMGISEESRERIFSPLITTKASGMGLGLLYCKRAVEALGGSIDFESSVAVGTTFSVRLPTH